VLRNPPSAIWTDWKCTWRKRRRTKPSSRSAWPAASRSWAAGADRVGHEGLLR